MNKKVLPLFLAGLSTISATMLPTTLYGAQASSTKKSAPVGFQASEVEARTSAAQAQVDAKNSALANNGAVVQKAAVNTAAQEPPQLILQGTEPNEIYLGKPNIYAPDVLFENGVYKMWYGAGGTDTKDRILYAESTDGVNWDKKGIAVEAPAGSYNANDPTVVKANGKYYMYFTVSESDLQDRIYMATSSDGKAWSTAVKVVEKDTFSWASRYVSRPTVLYDNGVFKMWYDTTSGSEYSAAAADSFVGYATSTDGVHWEQYSEPLFRSYAAVDVKKVQGIYVMLLQGANEGTLVATSGDGLSWTKQGTVIAPFSIGTGQTLGQLTPYLFVDPVSGKPTAIYLGASVPDPARQYAYANSAIYVYKLKEGEFDKFLKVDSGTTNSYNNDGTLASARTRQADGTISTVYFKPSGEKDYEAVRDRTDSINLRATVYRTINGQSVPAYMEQYLYDGFDYKGSISTEYNYLATGQLAYTRSASAYLNTVSYTSYKPTGEKDYTIVKDAGETKILSQTYYRQLGGKTVPDKVTNNFYDAAGKYTGTATTNYFYNPNGSLAYTRTPNVNGTVTYGSYKSTGELDYEITKDGSETKILNQTFYRVLQSRSVVDRTVNNAYDASGALKFSSATSYFYAMNGKLAYTRSANSDGTIAYVSYKPTGEKDYAIVKNSSETKILSQTFYRSLNGQDVPEKVTNNFYDAAGKYTGTATTSYFYNPNGSLAYTRTPNVNGTITYGSYKATGELDYEITKDSAETKILSQTYYRQLGGKTVPDKVTNNFYDAAGKYTGTATTNYFYNPNGSLAYTRTPNVNGTITYVSYKVANGLDVKNYQIIKDSTDTKILSQTYF